MLLLTILYRLPISSMTFIFRVMSKRPMSFISNSGHLSKEQPHSMERYTIGTDNYCFCLGRRLGSRLNLERSIYRANTPFQPLWQLFLSLMSFYQQRIVPVLQHNKRQLSIINSIMTISVLDTCKWKEKSWVICMRPF